MREIWVHYHQETRRLRWFEGSPEEVAGLADDLTQVDCDGIRRVYRRADGLWYAYLFTRVPADVLAPVRERMIEIRGLTLVAKAERCVVSVDYRLPRVAA